MKQSLGKEVYVKGRYGRELKGRLHAYDIHLNLMMSDVEETINKTTKKSMELIFVRGDLVILLSPILNK